jgi:hypothetical protein
VLTPPTTVPEAALLLSVYAEAETRLAGLIARRAARRAAGDPVSSIGWAERKHAETAALRAEVTAVLVTAHKTAAADVAGLLHGYGTRAHDDATRTLPDSRITIRTNTAVVDAAVRRLQASLATAATGTVDAAAASYRTVIDQAAAQVLTGTVTRQQIAADVADRLADKGLARFTDTAGRTWHLSSYADMAVRTATHQTYLDVALDTYQGLGQEYVIVSDTPHECAKCRPYEGRVLSLGPDTPPAGLSGFTYAGTVQTARSSGLWHPGCGHSLNAWTPGLTRPVNVTALANPAGDRLRQQQRAHERSIRDAKRSVHAAEQAAEETGDPTAVSRRRAVLRRRQAALRVHLARPDVQAAGLRRKPHQEAI